MKQFIISNLVWPDKQIDDDETDQAYDWIATETVINVHLQNWTPKRASKGEDWYEIIKEVGNGSFAKVYLVKCKISKMVFALKRMQKKLIKKTNTVTNVMLECTILKKL